MNKFLIKLLILYFFLTTYSFSEIINDIQVNGNKRVSKESIILFSDLKNGINFEEDLLNDSVKKLYDSNFFENVEISYANSTVFINVIEYPIIEDLTITGIKKKSFLDFIIDNINLRTNASFNDYRLQNDLNIIDNILRTNGYFFNNVTVKQNFDEELNTVNLKLDIKLGNKAKINQINFIGKKIFKNKKLLEIIASEESRFWKFISKKFSSIVVYSFYKSFCGFNL